MQIHQLRHVVDHLLGVLQRSQSLADHLGADHLVVMEADAPIGLMATGRGLADVVQQRRPAQNQITLIGTTLQRDRLSQHRQRMLIHILVLMVFVDGHLHAADLREHHITESGLHHQLDTRHRIRTQQHLVELDGHPLDGDSSQLGRHRDDGLTHPVGHSELKL